MPASPTSRSWPVALATTPCSSGTPTRRSIPRTVPAGDPRLYSYEGVLPGFRALIEDPWEQGSPAWGRWLAAQGVDVPANPHDLYQPIEGFPGADRPRVRPGPRRASTSNSRRPTFIRQSVVEWLESQC